MRDFLFALFCGEYGGVHWLKISNGEFWKKEISGADRLIVCAAYYRFVTVEYCGFIVLGRYCTVGRMMSCTSRAKSQCASCISLLLKQNDF